MSEENKSAAEKRTQARRSARKNRKGDSGSNQSVEALEKSSAAFDSNMNKTSDKIEPKNIIKEKNSRDTFLTFDEVRQAEWPALDTSGEKLEKKLQEVISGLKPNWNSKELKRAVVFFLGIHELAVSYISEARQISPIVVYRNSLTDSDMFLIAGERRTLAALYAGSDIVPHLDANILEGKPNPLRWAITQDQENTQVPTDFGETISRKKSIWDAAVEEGVDVAKSSTKELGVYFNYRSRDKIIAMRKYLLLPFVDEFIGYLKRKGYGQKEAMALIKLEQEALENLIENDGDFKIEEPKKTPEEEKETKHKKSESSDSGDTKEPANPMAAAAKTIGISLGKKTNTRLLRLLVNSAQKTGLVPEGLRDEISDADLGDNSELLRVIVQLNEAIGEGE